MARRSGARMLEDVPVPIRLRLALLWSSVMFCYVYGDIFGLFKPGKLAALLAGQTPVGPTTQLVLLCFAALMAIPSLMIVVSITVPTVVSRWLNILFGAAYSAILALTLPGAWHFYLLLGIIEIGLTSLIVFTAWNWPRVTAV